uniref:GUN4-like domain-containing protein n=1 Tax=Chromera velia CCMP2878 TaxID=1169474 RepID=A0A0G4G8J0_9ALVE|eukprot:Cvel_20706.t1-p1 / transcript=Cvel_20706.t1 / gene=Cvel_20706 / organism=Chromera_velia_CCMP2878 / gene_product=Ycf53-like protein, putative / transcript_product=Ycf53-like protein, putative / location=Cvel_scaffold1885:9721-10461(+) / protein_length=247 / sequence_SO=supercontig / SO=protein_coding / is_pseudo=false
MVLFLLGFSALLLSPSSVVSFRLVVPQQSPSGRRHGCLSPLYSLEAVAMDEVGSVSALSQASGDGPAKAVETAAAAPSVEVNPEEIADCLKSDIGKDYLPLAQMLANKDFVGADQFTRDALIQLAGPNAQSREFVYFTDLPKLPATDLFSIEKLWLKYSGGKFGYTVQRKIYRGCKGDLNKFWEKLGWSLVDDGVVRLRRWFGENEFIYDLEKAPKGHLPLTNSLRGTTLLKGLMELPVWDRLEESS